MSPRIARCAFRGDLLANALNIVIGIKQPDRGVNVVKINDQLTEDRAGVRELAGDLRPLLDKTG
jgi:hypothetical protein